MLFLRGFLVYFIIDAIGQLDLSGFKVNYARSGSGQYPPEMMLILYCYVDGRMSSGVIEATTYTDVAVRNICGNRAHPEHTVICRFRRENQGAFKAVFTKVLVTAREMGHLKGIGNISVEGTKTYANAGKHRAVSCQRAKEMTGGAEKEVKELMAKAEEAASRPLEEGLTIPEEIKLREERKGAMEERYEEVRKEEQAEYEWNMEEREGGASARAGGTGEKSVQLYRSGEPDNEGGEREAF